MSEPKGPRARYQLNHDYAALLQPVPDTRVIGEATSWRELRAMAAGAIPFERGGCLWALDRETRSVLYVADMRQPENPAVRTIQQDDDYPGGRRVILRHSRTCKRCGDRPVEQEVFTTITRLGHGDATKTTQELCDECANIAADCLRTIGLEVAIRQPDEDFPTDWDVLIQPLPQTIEEATR